LASPLVFVVIVSRTIDGRPIVVERVPARQPLTVHRPAADFLAQHWSA